MPPPSRSSTNPSPVSPSHGLNVRDNYSSLVPRPSRYGVSHQSTIHSMTTSPLSPMSAVSRALDSSGRRDSPHPFNLPGASIPSDATHMYTPSASMVPPFDPTKPFSQIVDSNNSPIQVEIQAKIDKGFFKAESDWTCYRRNYFSVLCCYVLRPDVDLSARQLFLVRNSSRDRIQSFSVLIIAKVDGEDGKLVELVQHTPKRDKGPLTAPELTELSPHPSNGLGSYPSSSSAGRAAQVNSDFENYPSTVSPSQCVATFERIQFKKATANNGKRRAAQQYFHVVVELHAKILRAKSGEVQTVKVAHRISAPMVVRGRSPGHYSDDRRGSMGTGSGPSADFGSAQGNPGSAGPSADHLGGRNGGSYSNSGHMSSGGYQSHHMSMDHSSSDGNSMGSSVASNVGTVHLYDQQRPDPSLTEEDATKFDQYDGYQYYPATLFENASNAEPNRPILPLSLNKQPASTQTPNMGNVLAATDNMTGYYAQRMRVKAEQPPDSTLGLQSNGSRSYGSYSNESTWGDGVNVLRDCRRYQGTDTSKGYYPAMPTI
jgi:meiosis-specific transcription factor NDT80